jgi:hypothetical protein
MGNDMKELARNYTVEVDKANNDAWNEIIKRFDDANIYNTSAYGEMKFGKKNISRAILKNNGEIAAVAQSRIVKIPVLNAGIAYIRWGPLWRAKGHANNIETFRQILRALRNEYAIRRGYVLRIYPMLFDDAADTFSPILKEEGYVYRREGKKDRTILIDLKAPVADLRKGLAQKWRNSLNKAERSNIEIIEGEEDALFEKFIEIYRDMLQRKKFVEPNDINEFRWIQKHLPEEMKMQIVLCRHEGHICSGGIFSAMGDTGLYLFGATNDAGMNSNGSYLIQWKYLEWLKENNLAFYDLNGINPETNPGTYKFKEGLCGKNGKDVFFLGQWETCDNAFSRVVVHCGEKLAAKVKQSRKNRAA